MTIQVLVRNYNRIEVGEEAGFLKLDVVGRHKDTSSWAVTMPNTAMANELRQPGAGIVIRRNDKTLLSGPMTSVERSVVEDTDDFVIAGLSDECMLWDFVCQTSAPQDIGGELFQFEAYDNFTGSAEEVFKHYVNGNLGDASRALAGIPPVTTAVNLNRGPTITGNARFTLVGDLINSLDTDLGYTLVDNVFDVYQPADRTAEQLFSVSSGNLLGYGYKYSAPKVTHPYVAGSGELSDRIFYLGADDAAATKWGRRIETFIDARDTGDAATLKQRSAKALIDGGEQTTVTLRPIDVPNRTYGEDYGLGDLVTVEGVRAVLAQVEISVDENGETISPAVSAQNAAAAQNVLQIFDDLRRLRRQLLELQTRF